MQHYKDLQTKATELRIECLKAIHKAESGHPGGSLSAMDILVTLYYGRLNDEPIMKYDPQTPGSPEQDYFVLSKGHGAPALYAVLADRGFFESDELDYMRQINGLLQGLPVVKIPGITVSSGSAGHGFAAAHGLCLALKQERKKNMVYTLLGDGELQQGLVWETAMSAAHFKSDNLIAFIDNNHLQGDGVTRAIMNVDSIVDKFESFGWRAIRVKNGHDFEELLSALERAFITARKPTCIICETVKGKGVRFAEKNPVYHSVAFSDEEMEEAIPVLEKELAKLTEHV